MYVALEESNVSYRYTYVQYSEYCVLATYILYLTVDIGNLAIQHYSTIITLSLPHNTTG